jgi:hypothetical protein
VPDRKTPVAENQLGDIVERITTLSPAYLSEYVVPRLSAWQARATLTFAVIAAARRATQGHADWPATDIWRLARALRDRAPGLYAVLIALLEHVEPPGPTV